MNRSVGVCELCGDEVHAPGPQLPISAHTCGRCGRWVCSGCGGYSLGRGYGIEDEWKYGKICKECYYELQGEYAAKWEAEFGAEERARGMENPYDLSEEQNEWRKRIREYMAQRDGQEQES
jgi:hypothetical protein